MRLVQNEAYKSNIYNIDDISWAYYSHNLVWMEIKELLTSGLRAGNITISCKACFAISCPAANKE